MPHWTQISNQLLDFLLERIAKIPILLILLDTIS